MSIDDEIAKFGPDRVQLQTPEAEFASWLATLDGAIDQRLKAQATKRLAEMFLFERADSASLLAQLEAAQRENGKLREFRRAVAALTLETMPGAVALIIPPAVQAPGQKPSLRVVPKPEVDRG